MSLDTALRSLILEAAGGRVGTRVRPLHLAQQDGIEAPPCIVYQVQREPTEQTLDDGPLDWRNASIDLACYAPTRGEVEELADVLQDALDGLERTMAAAKVEFGSIAFEDGTDAEQVPPDGESAGFWLKTDTYKVLYRRVGGRQ